jgi:hypothetical protein
MVGVGFMAGGRVGGVTMAGGRMIVAIFRQEGWGGESETNEAECECACVIDFHDFYGSSLFLFFEQLANQWD